MVLLTPKYVWGWEGKSRWKKAERLGGWEEKEDQSIWIIKKEEEPVAEAEMRWWEGKGKSAKRYIILQNVDSEKKMKYYVHTIVQEVLLLLDYLIINRAESKISVGYRRAYAKYDRSESSNDKYYFSINSEYIRSRRRIAGESEKDTREKMTRRQVGRARRKSRTGRRDRCYAFNFKYREETFANWFYANKARSGSTCPARIILSWPAGRSPRERVRHWEKSQARI